MYAATVHPQGQLELRLIDLSDAGEREASAGAPLVRASDRSIGQMQRTGALM